MSRQRFDLGELDDQKLLDSLVELNRTAAETMADLLCHLAEVDRRKLYLGQACSSLFNYAVERLGCTEDEASRRIHAARAGARFPAIFELVARGEVALTAVSRLAPHLTQENHVTVLAAAKGKTLREIEELVARLAPKPDVAPRLVRVPERSAAAPQPIVPAAAAHSLSLPATAAGSAPTLTAAPAPLSMNQQSQPTSTPLVARARVQPLSAERWALRVTIGAAARQALRKAQDLSNPRRDEAAIVEQALLEYAERLEARKHAKLKGGKAAPPPRLPAVERRESGPERPSEHLDGASATATAPIPGVLPVTDTPLHVAKHVAADATAAERRAGPPGRARRPSRAVMREVRERDGNRCTFMSADGHRCSATARLEFHHLLAWALGGDTTAEQLTLRCRAHHAHQTALDFGADHVAQAIARRRRRRDARVRDPNREHTAT